MENNTIAGFHHLTAIVGDPQQNVDFYTRVLGQRLVKRTVGFAGRTRPFDAEATATDIDQPQLGP